MQESDSLGERILATEVLLSEHIKMNAEAHRQLSVSLRDIEHDILSLRDHIVKGAFIIGGSVMGGSFIIIMALFGALWMYIK